MSMSTLLTIILLFINAVLLSAYTTTTPTTTTQSSDVETITPSLFPESYYQSHFIQYMKQFRKSYDIDEIFTRYHYFKVSLNQIEQHNAQQLSWRMGLNPHSDLSPMEFRNMKARYVRSTQQKESGNRKLRNLDNDVAVPPASIDWRTKNAVTPVQNEGSCGACWAFVATGAMEGAWAIAKGQLIPLSNQQLVDCSEPQGNSGCDGGFMDNAFQFVIDNKGICSASGYPYSGDQGTCKTSCEKVVTISSYVDVASLNETALLYAVADQPVAVAVEADESAWQNYAGGILTDPNCGTNVDFAVLIVGYGTENGVDYWIAKNDWGVDWGESGYIRIVRNKNECGIAMEPSYPVV